MADPTPTHSTSPNGEEFPLPVAADYQAENDRLSALVKEHKALGHEIVAASRVFVLGASYREDVGNPAVIIDCFTMLSDTQIKTFFAACLSLILDFDINSDIIQV